MSQLHAESQAPDASPRRYFWERHASDAGSFRPPAGEDLAALRRGVGFGPGEAPPMWPFYTRLNRGGSVTPGLWAEHIALVLYGIHQQGQSRPMHVKGIRPGEALHALRASGRYGRDALDARVARAATSPGVHELAHHLRGLVTMLKTLDRPQPMDYTKLCADLRAWQAPDQVGRVRRRWGADYFRVDKNATDTTRKDQS